MPDQEYRPMAKERGRRNSALRRLGFSSYDAYLGGDHWQATRRAYFASDRPQKCICGETENLQLHHITYERVGAERLDDLRVLCAGCHTMLHVLEDRGDSTLDPASIGEADAASRADVLSDLERELAAALELPIEESVAAIKAVTERTDQPWREMKIRHMDKMLANCMIGNKGRRRSRRRKLRQYLKDSCNGILLQVEGRMIDDEALADLFDQSNKPAHPMSDMSGTMSGRWAGWRTEVPASPVTIRKISQTS